jgi:hypothetical protein
LPQRLSTSRLGVRFCTALFWTAFAASSSLGQSTVGIFFQFDHVPSPAVLTAMRDETARLMAPAGFATIFQGSSPTTAIPTTAFDTSLSVRLKGACHTAATLRLDSAHILDPFAPSTVRLAATRTSGRSVLPVAEVECDTILSALHSIPLKRRSRIFGYALGRVIAHELYHVLLQSTGHGSNGLARAVVSWSELLSDSLQFDAGDLHRLLHTTRH